MCTRKKMMQAKEGVWTAIWGTSNRAGTFRRNFKDKTWISRCFALGPSAPPLGVCADFSLWNALRKRCCLNTDFFCLKTDKLALADDGIFREGTQDNWIFMVKGSWSRKAGHREPWMPVVSWDPCAGAGDPEGECSVGRGPAVPSFGVLPCPLTLLTSSHTVSRTPQPHIPACLEMQM